MEEAMDIPREKEYQRNVYKDLGESRESVYSWVHNLTSGY